MTLSGNKIRLINMESENSKQEQNKTGQHQTQCPLNSRTNTGNCTRDKAFSKNSV